MNIARYRSAAAQRLRECASPADVGIVDPRTGEPPATWLRAQELMVGEMIRAKAAEPLTRWQRALL